MKPLLTVSAVLEGVTGLALVVRPSALAGLLFGVPLNAPVALTVGRVAGVALLALGLGCWLARVDAQGRTASGLVFAMLLYNWGVLAVLAFAGLASGLAGLGLLPAAVAHLVLGAWCARNLATRHA